MTHFVRQLLSRSCKKRLTEISVLLQAKAKTEKQLKKEKAFPQRKFAVKA